MRRYRASAERVLVAGLGAAACTPAPQALPAEAAPAAPARASADCPYPEFDAFLAHFGSEIALQEEATADPLLDSYIDPEAEPEPRKVESRLALADVEWPVMPDPAALAGQGRELQVSTLADGQRRVQIRTPDSSDQQSYTFAQAPCWTLVKREDEAI